MTLADTFIQSFGDHIEKRIHELANQFAEREIVPIDALAKVFQDSLGDLPPINVERSKDISVEEMIHLLKVTKFQQLKKQELSRLHDAQRAHSLKFLETLPEPKAKSKDND